MNQPGKCYDNCIAAMCRMAKDYEPGQLLLCHGYPRLAAPDHGHPAGALFGHAWLEAHTTICFDAQRGMWVPHPVFYVVGQVDPEWVARYTYDEMLAKCDEHGTAGPWHGEPPGVAWPA